MLLAGLWIVVALLIVFGFDLRQPERPRPWARPGVRAVAIGTAFGLATTTFGTGILHSYGWGLFVVLPFFLGLLTSLVLVRGEARRLRDCEMVSMLAGVGAGIGLLAFGLEGAICILMALPLGIGLALIGGLVGYLLQKRVRQGRSAPALWILTLAGAPLFLGAEAAVAPLPPLFSVTTAIEVNAPPEKVWPWIVAFPDIGPPEDWAFRAGVAYPVRTEIHGSGVGAPRACILSTGALEETVEAWDPPRRLAFRVTHTPPSMRELSPYDIHPAHLEGFYVSRRGEFRLTALPGGRTRVEGTSWYQNAFWPSAYWRLWSDDIVHRIHGRVLRHIKALAERRASADLTPGSAPGG